MTPILLHIYISSKNKNWEACPPSVALLQGMSEEAELRADVASCRQILGNKHLDTLRAIASLADLLHDQGKLAEAEPLRREALAGRRKTMGDKHPGTVTSINNMATLLLDQGKLAERRRCSARLWLVSERRWETSTTARLHASTTWLCC